jgi:hypothetical protein
MLIPRSRGSPPRTKDFCAEAKTKGSTGKMQGLRIVRRPAQNVRKMRLIEGSPEKLFFESF